MMGLVPSKERHQSACSLSLFPHGHTEERLCEHCEKEVSVSQEVDLH